MYRGHLCGKPTQLCGRTLAILDHIYGFEVVTITNLKIIGSVNNSIILTDSPDVA